MAFVSEKGWLGVYGRDFMLPWLRNPILFWRKIKSVSSQLQVLQSDVEQLGMYLVSH